MKVWIDVLTPKQANFFSVFVSRLREHNHGVQVTTRHYREVEQLLQIREVNATIVGRHGGRDLIDKLAESSRRIEELADRISKNGPDLAISFCSPEAARVAYGLGIPHYGICDSPHAEAVCKLSIPLSRKLFTPRIIPKRAWARYCLASRDIVQYNALDPAVWIRAYAPGPDVTSSVGLDHNRPYVVLRTEEEYASYLLGRERSTDASIVGIAQALSELGTQVVVLPRYEKQVDLFSRKLARAALVPNRVIDAVGLLSRASVFVGAGGTMSAEAALMGVPTISCYPGEPTYVDRYLFRMGLAERVSRMDKIIRRVQYYLNNEAFADRRKKKAKTVLSRMEDPILVVMSHLGLL